MQHQCLPTEAVAKSQVSQNKIACVTAGGDPSALHVLLPEPALGTQTRSAAVDSSAGKQSNAQAAEYKCITLHTPTRREKEVTLSKASAQCHFQASSMLAHGLLV
jgi:hypothetical protein